MPGTTFPCASSWPKTIALLGDGLRAGLRQLGFQVDWVRDGEASERELRAELLEAERRFTDAAAHELRTPLAAIRAQAQVALAEADEGRRRHALEATLSGCDRATHLVEQLLMLSRLEGGRR